MRLKLTALAFLGLSHAASASEITRFSSEDPFFRLVMNPSTEFESAVYAHINQNAFSGDQLYLFKCFLR